MRELILVFSCRSIPTIISQATSGTHTVSRIPRGEPGSDLGQHFQLSTSNSTSTSHSDKPVNTSGRRFTAETSFATCTPSDRDHDPDHNPSLSDFKRAEVPRTLNSTPHRMPDDGVNEQSQLPTYQADQTRCTSQSTEPAHQERVDRFLGFDLELFNAGIKGDTTSVSNPWAKVNTPSLDPSRSISTSTPLPMPTSTSTSTSASALNPGTLGHDHYPNHGDSNSNMSNCNIGNYGASGDIPSSIIPNSHYQAPSQAPSNMWDVISGGREDELDFDAFLQSFGGGEYTS